MEKLKTEFLMITKSESNDCQSIVNHLVRLIKLFGNYSKLGKERKSEPKNASSGYKRTGRREKLPEWAIDQEAYLKKKR